MLNKIIVTFCQVIVIHSFVYELIMDFGQLLFGANNYKGSKHKENVTRKIPFNIPNH
jgi:hypothetical protein